MKLEDGGGSGRLAKVNKDQKLETLAVTVAELDLVSAANGEAFYINSGFVALTTTATPSAILYVLNNSDKDLHISELRTCGTMSQQWEILFNPTGGTIQGSGTQNDAESLNLGSSATLDATILYGADALTVTGEARPPQWINNDGHSSQDTAGAIIIPKGKSFGLRCKPAVAGDVCVNLLAYLSEAGAL